MEQNRTFKVSNTLMYQVLGDHHITRHSSFPCKKPTDSCESRPEPLMTLKLFANPFGEFFLNRFARVALIEEEDGCEVPFMSDGPTDGLVHCFHTNVLIVFLSGVPSNVRVQKFHLLDEFG